MQYIVRRTDGRDGTGRDGTDGRTDGTGRDGTDGTDGRTDGRDGDPVVLLRFYFDDPVTLLRVDLDNSICNTNNEHTRNRFEGVWSLPGCYFE